MKRIVCTLVILLSLSGPAWSGFDEGAAAYKRGDYATALHEIRPLAEQGDARSQNSLALMYANGRGVPRDYAEAARWYRMAGEQGYAIAQHFLGVMYENGKGVAQDYSGAARWYRKAAAQGNAKAQFNLGSLYDRGRGVPHDPREAARWYRKSALQGHDMGQIMLGLMYELGDGMPQDYVAATRWFRKSAEQGLAEVQYVLGRAYHNGRGVVKNYVEALRWYRKAAAQGHNWAQNNLGVLYTDGLGVAQDHAEAARWYRKAAEKGVPEAQYALGLSYDKGRGVARDDTEAVRWYRKAAEQGLEASQFRLGLKFAGSRGVARDDAEAVRWYRKAASQGYAMSQYGMGVMYHYGRGVTKDFVESVRWFRKAAEQGHVYGQKFLGNVYRHGQGVEQDYFEAYKWLSLAASRLSVAKSREETVEARNEVASHVTSTQQSKAEQWVQDWRPRKFARSNLTEPAVRTKPRKLANTSRPTASVMSTAGHTGSDSKLRRARPPGPMVPRTLISGIQRGLAELGYNPGPADGSMGPKTRAAIAAFQRSAGLTVSGEPSEQLEKALRAAKSARATTRNRYGIAVIIGNKTYKGRTPPVDFAHNDADAMKRFVIERLGYRPGNVIDLRDASKGELEDVFGTRDTHRGKLADWTRAGRSDVVVFYSGPGVPGLEDRRGYLLPVDGNPNRARITGYPVDLLYANLARIGAKSVTVYLDACFSGDSPKGMLVRAASGLSVTPRKADAAPGLVVLTAASGDQFASWDEDAKHGLFTLHLLKALRGAADTDAYGKDDGRITLGEVKKYLDDEMSYQARRRYGRAQTVSVQGAASLVLTKNAVVDRQ